MSPLINKTSKNKSPNRSLLKGSAVALIIGLSPFIFYSYKGLPEGEIWETFLFNFKSEYYKSIYIFGWVFMSKFLPFLLLCIWFLTCKHWWRHVIIIPVIMYVFQILTVLNDDLQYFDVVELWYVFPMMLIIVPFMYLIRAKLFEEINDESLEEFEKRIGTKRNIFQQIGDLFR